MVARETLRGIKGVRIQIEKIDPEIEKAGLTEKQIRTDVELKLRLAGLKVLSVDESAVLLVRVGVFKSSSGEYIWNVFLALYQWVNIPRLDIEVSAATWFIMNHGISPDTDFIRNELKNCMDEFINAWLSVNPKK